MNTTRSTLLERIKDRSDAPAWHEFHQLYGPLLFRYAQRCGLSRDDAEEVRDQCFEVIVRRIGAFEYDRAKGRFKGWLQRMATRKVVDLLRKRRENVADSHHLRAVPDAAPTPQEAWERQWTRQHLRFCVDRVRGSVSEINFQAFCLLLFDECAVQDVCDRLSITANQVYKARARILKLVRRELAELGVDAL